MHNHRPLLSGVLFLKFANAVNTASSRPFVLLFRVSGSLFYNTEKKYSQAEKTLHSVALATKTSWLSISLLQWNPDFSNLLGKSKLVRIIEVFEKSGVKLQCLTGEGKSVLVRIIGSFEKPRVREIGILLYFYIFINRANTLGAVNRLIVRRIIIVLVLYFRLGSGRRFNLIYSKTGRLPHWPF